MRPRIHVAVLVAPSFSPVIGAFAQGIGSGVSPGGLAGDNPSAPGFPGKVGR